MVAATRKTAKSDACRREPSIARALARGAGASTIGAARVDGRDVHAFRIALEIGASLLAAALELSARGERLNEPRQRILPEAGAGRPRDGAFEHRNGPRGIAEPLEPESPELEGCEGRPRVARISSEEDLVGPGRALDVTGAASEVRGVEELARGGPFETPGAVCIRGRRRTRSSRGSRRGKDRARRRDGDR